MAAEAKPKKATISLVDRTSAEGGWIYAKVHELVGAHHKHLVQATIAVAMKHNWSDDTEGRSPTGQLIAVPELYWRFLEGAGEGAPPDFLLLLNAPMWERADEAQRLYMLDEQLCYGEQRTQKDGDQAEDTTGRKLWRLRKPDFVGFGAPVARHGAQLRGVKTFFLAAGVKQGALFGEKAPARRRGRGEGEEAEPAAPLPAATTAEAAASAAH